MTQDKDFKKLVRAHAKKTGKRYAAALKDFQHTMPSASPTMHVEAPADETVAEASYFARFLAEPFPVVVGRMPAIGHSADYATAAEQARDLANNPKYFAENGSLQSLLSLAEIEALAAAGAARADDVQMIRTFRDEHRSTFSEQCRRCDRWIWCGDQQREANCACGQKYRVVFDLNRLYHWSQHTGCRCIDCGAEFQMTTPDENRNPWGRVNTWQLRCHDCSTRERRFKVETRRAGSFGLFHVESLTEDGRNMTHLVDPERQFFHLEQLRKHLATELGCPVDLARV